MIERSVTLICLYSADRQAHAVEPTAALSARAAVRRGAQQAAPARQGVSHFHGEVLVLTGRTSSLFDVRLPAHRFATLVLKDQVVARPSLL